MLSGWTALIVAGCFEVGFTSFLKLSDGFTRPIYVALFIITAALSFAALSIAVRTIPLGTAYAVWTGIGAFGTAIVGMAFFKDPASLPRLFFLGTLILSIIGLKLVSSEPS
jgi:quaternary ammonium compound-resistance protein SugE